VKSHKNARINNYGVFVVLNTNDTIFGKKWTQKYSHKSWYIKIDDRRLNVDSVKAFQNNYVIAVKYVGAFAAFFFIDQWSHYLRRGKINVFSHNIYAGRRPQYNSTTKSMESVDEFSLEYLYQVNNGPIIGITGNGLRGAISDNSVALNLFDSIFEIKEDNIIKLKKEGKTHVNKTISNSEFVSRVLEVIDINNK
jgi:hypothetical protein